MNKQYFIDIKKALSRRLNAFLYLTFWQLHRQFFGYCQQVPIKFSKITAPNGHFSIKYRFAHEGTYQIIVKVNSNYFALALASFKMVIPFQPFGVFNTSHVFPLLIPVISASSPLLKSL
jgi:hypothetical protein